ncbi:hypothetical protein PS1_025933 [Malus domestica]
MGLCDAWVNTVMRCVSSVQFSMLLNGQHGKKFKPSRGVRKGDPLSPYQFFIVSEVLSRLIKRVTDLGFLDGIQLSANGPKLTHLLFTDDMLVFLKATPDNCRNMSNLLKAYNRAFGQQVSLQKSMVYFSANTLMVMAQKLSVNLEMTVVDDPGVYLGVSMVWGWSKQDALAYINDRVLAKIMGWKQ